MMKPLWRKCGRIYSHSGTDERIVSHAANPIAVPMGGDLLRVFFSSRDARNRSSVAGVDIDLSKLSVIAVHETPFFVCGGTESFFRAGIGLGGTYVAGGRSYILFMAWQNDPGQHWRGDIGRFRLINKERLVLDSPKDPFLGIDGEDQISLSYPWVLRTSDGFKMWYGSTVSWDAGNGEMLHVIKYATSEDGHVWVRHGQVIPHELGQAQAFSRPTVIHDESGYHMWFSFRGGHGTKYRIGYAFSDDGEGWRVDLENSGIDVSDEGWDSEMIEYPFVFHHRGECYMLYNGNDYGRTGFGLAVLEK